MKIEEGFFDKGGLMEENRRNNCQHAAKFEFSFPVTLCHMDKSPTSQACALAKVSIFFSLNILYWQVLKQEKIAIKFRGFQTLL